MKTTTIGLIGVIGSIVAAVGCGAAPTSEDLGTTEQAFDNYVGTPPGYPTTALPFDSSTARLFQNGDWDNNNTLPLPRATYTNNDGYFFGAECDLHTTYHDYVVGISARTYIRRAHSAKCRNDDSHHVTGAPASYHYLSRKDSAGNPKDDRVGSDVSWNWDTNGWKADCAFHQVVTGVAQLESGEIDGIACTSANVNRGPSTTSCQTVRFDANNHCPSGNCGSTDWAPGYAKNLCRSDQYIKAVSKDKVGVPSQGIPSQGEISAILCCDWG